MNKQHPVYELSQADPASQEMVPEMIENVKRIESILWGIYLHPGDI